MVDSAASEPDAASFRRAERTRLVALRRSAGPELRAAVQANVERVVAALLASTPQRCFAFYWPIRGEIALFAAMRSACAAGATVALPVIVDRNGPLQFRRWTPTTRMQSGVWNIPEPGADEPFVDPQVLFVPLVGYDAMNFRLGNGGGYYDRTLAARTPRPHTIGVGLTSLFVPTIRPQSHDVPMDRIVTEVAVDGGAQGASGDRVECASPPCAMPPLDGPPERA